MTLCLQLIEWRSQSNDMRISDFRIGKGVEASDRGLIWVNITAYTWWDLEHNSKPEDNTCLCRDLNTESSSLSVILRVSQSLKANPMKISNFWHLAQCSLLQDYQRK
jgi:hypothetical protein